MDFLSLPIIFIGLAVIVVIIGGIFLLSRYVKVTTSDLLVIFGKTGTHKEKTKVLVDMVETVLPDGTKQVDPVYEEIEFTVRSSKQYHGGAAFVIPVLQGWAKMSMNPNELTLSVRGVTSQILYATVPTTIIFAISKDPAIQQNAANRLLGLTSEGIKGLVESVVYGQMRFVMSRMSIEELISDREKFLREAKNNITNELSKLGIDLVTINISDIKDEVGYIDNLGKKSATEAKMKALGDIAEQEKSGEIRIAEQIKEKETKIAETEKQQTVAITETLKKKAVELADLEKSKAIELAELQKTKEVTIAETERSKQVGIATATKEQLSEIAIQEAEQRKAIADQEALAETAEAEARSLTASNVVKAEAESISLQEEARAQKEIRVATARELQAAEAEKVRQEREAKVAAYESEKRQKAAEANRDASVKEHTTTIEVSDARAKAEVAKAAADQKSGEAKVEAEAAIKIKAEKKQQEINAAKAKAKEEELKASIIVPKTAEKEQIEIEAAAEKAKVVIAAEAEAAKIKLEAEAQAQAILQKAQAEAEGQKLQLLAQAEGELQMQLAKAKGIQEIEKAPAMAVEQMLQAGMTPEAIVQYRMSDQWKHVAEAGAEMFEHIHLGNITVYGSENTVGQFMADTARNINPALAMLKDIPFAEAAKQIFTGKKVEANTETEETKKDNFEEVK